MMQTANVLHEHFSKLETESTPLRELVSKIPVRYWSMFRGVELGQRLGFKTAMKCTSLHHVMRYIGWNESVSQGTRLPYQFYIDASVICVTLDDLIASSDHVPNDVFVSMIRVKLDG